MSNNDYILNLLNIKDSNINIFNNIEERVIKNRNYKIIEGNKERVQAYEGIVIAIKNSGVAKNFVVRKISSGVGVERTFPMNSPKIDSVEVVRKGKVRRAKLTYLRNIVGTPKIKERRDKDQMKKAA